MKPKTINTYLTRQNDVTDINPQCFSRETVIGNHWDQTSVMSGSPKTTHIFRCHGCNTRLLNARYIVDNHETLCSTCIDSEGLHAQLWPACNSAWHQPLDHLTDIRFNGSSAL